MFPTLSRNTAQSSTDTIRPLHLRMNTSPDICVCTVNAINPPDAFCYGRRKTSSSGQEALDRLSPLSTRGVTLGDFTGPGTRHVLWGSGEKDDSLAWVRCPNLLVEFERFLAGVPAN